TVSAWVAQSHSGIADDRIFSKAPSTTTSQALIHLAVDDTHLMRVRLSTDGSGGTVASSVDGTTVMSELTWYHLTFTWSSITESTDLYLNGNWESSSFKDGDSVRDSDIMFIIGNWATQTGNSRHWNGTIDEIRMLPTALSADWIETEFNNQNNPSGFYTVDTQEKTIDTWTDASEPSVHFTTSSPNIVTMDVNLVMDVGGAAQSMDENFDEGVNYFIESGSSIVNWTAKVMVSPPAGATSFGFSVEYPRAEWKATQVINPVGQPKTVGQDWWYNGGTLTLNASSIDFWGVWTLNFISWNFMQDLQLDDSAYKINDVARFTMTTPTVLGARVGLDLVRPDGITWYSTYNQTATDPAHRFPSFQYRKNITIPSSEIQGSVTDFPVLIQIDDTDLHDPVKARSDGSDILFAQGDTILDHEIEFFDQNYFINEARLVAWVRTNLTSGVDNDVTMYYGSPIVDNLENPAGVWSNDFEAVWHLDELASSGLTHYDSSGNGYDGIRNGNVEDLARVGYGQTFDGNNDYISFDETLTPENDVVITGWFRVPSTHSASSPTTRVIMEKYIDIDNDMLIALVGQDYGQGTVPNGTLVFKVESSQNSAMYKWTQNNNWIANQWYFIACYADEDNPSNNKIWVNMNWDTAAGQVGSSTQANMSYVEEWQLGGGDYDSGIVGSGYFAGQLDEFRVSNTLRSDEWFRNEVRNQLNTGTFLSPGNEQVRTSPEHTLTKQILDTAPAGEWTAIVYYNDTGSYVTNKTGLIERTFIVRHPTLLSLQEPSDATGGSRTGVKTVGDALIIEYELTDTITTLGVPGALVTMNWTSPASITLDDYGSGLYGKVLDTTDLGDAKKWRFEFDSYHQYYNNETDYFYLDLYHPTTLTASGGSTTPADFIFNTTLTFEDDFTGAPITGATITESDGSSVTFLDNLDGTYDVSIPTSALSLGIHQYTFNATKSGAYLNVAQVDIEFTVRAHFTSVSVSGDMTTSYGDDTQVTVFLFDLDTGLAV
ncbi:MAG: LamG-like jellyroll fold domain-containing protein, partial [Candidatus Thorarchaeota archaeon]